MRAQLPISPPKGRNSDAVREQAVRRLREDGERLCRDHGRHGPRGRSLGAREKMREWMGGADFVGRDEFEAVKAMAAAARDENEILKARIAALEAKVAGPAAGAKRGAPSRRRTRGREPERGRNPGRARRRRSDRGSRAIFRGARLGVRAHRRGRDRRFGDGQLGAVRASRRVAARGPGAAVPRLSGHQGRAREARRRSTRR